ncbi:MAG: HEAT repeat domain-containing protein [Phycisphaeraceae bacterium]
MDHRAWIGALLVMMVVSISIAPLSAQSETPRWRGTMSFQDELDPAFAEEVLQYVQQHEPPRFREGHRLPPLSIFEMVPMNVMKHLAEAWGYALYMDVRFASVDKLDEPDSVVRQIVDLAASDSDQYSLQLRIAPQRYMLRLLSNSPKDEDHRRMREFFEKRYDYEWRRDFVSMFPRGAFVLNNQGEFVEHPSPPHAMNYAPSPQLGPMPEADTVIEAMAEMHAEMVEAIAEHAPIAIIVNGGEYGVQRGGHYPFAKLMADPRVREAWDADGPQPVIDYVSDRKAHQERLFRQVLTANITEPIYLYYSAVTGGHATRHQRHDWIHADLHYRPGVVTWPTPRHYAGYKSTGFVRDADLLTQALNGRAQELAAGAQHTYPWVSQGWPGRPLAVPESYQGFVTCLYTSGAVGGLVYGARPNALETMDQLLIQGRVHALFSHLDEFLFEGDLLPGPNEHRWSRDLPAYEFPTGKEHKRVLVRRHREQDRWLVTAWAADGEPATVEVNIPELGAVTLEATPIGNVMIFGKEDGQAVPEPVMGVDARASAEQLHEVLRNGDVIERQLALYHLATRGPAVMPRIVSALDDDEAMVRRIALRTLVRLNTAGAAEHLRRALDDEDTTVRRTAVDALASLHPADERIADWLEPLENDPDSEIRKTVVETLWPLDPPAPTPVPERITASEPQRVIALPTDDWRFHRDAKRRGHVNDWQTPGFDDRAWETIGIGEPWQAFGHDYVGVAWYRQSFELPKRIDHRDAVLHFEGVDESAWVWINGQYVGGQDIGPTGWNKPFRVAVTDVLRWGATNQITVRAMNTARAGGIWRPVSLELYGNDGTTE